MFIIFVYIINIAFIYKSHGVKKIHFNERNLDHIILGNIIFYLLYMH